MRNLATSNMLGDSADVAFAGTSVQSAAAPDQIFRARVNTTAACRILVGENPTALSTSTRLPADGSEYISIRPGQKIAVIQDADAATAGKLNYTWLDN